MLLDFRKATFQFPHIFAKPTFTLRNYGVYIIVRLYFRLSFSKNSPLSFGCKPKIMKADDYDGDNSDSIEVTYFNIRTFMRI